MNYNTISAPADRGGARRRNLRRRSVAQLYDEVIGEIRQALVDNQVIFFATST